MKFSICEKRTGMSSYGSRPFREFPTVEEFMKDEETQRVIQLADKFGDKWKIVEWVDDENKPHKVVVKGTSD